MNGYITLVVHPGTGTFMDANDGVLVVTMHTDALDSLDDSDVVCYAERHGVPMTGAVSA